MRKNILKLTRVFSIIACVMMSGVLLGFSGCSEDIDESNFAIKEKQTAMDFLSANPEFSGIKAIFERVRFGNRDNASTLASVLTARGNYTLFVPDNTALETYMQNVAGTTEVSELSDEIAQLIANSCIIDNENLSAYEVADFPESGTFNKQNLNNRSLSCTHTEDDEYVINNNSTVTRFDIEVSNGMIHVVNAVIAPSSDRLPELIALAGNMKVMSYLLTATEWANSLLEENDAVYEAEDHGETFIQSGVPGTFKIPMYRKIGYTALVETDDVFRDEWGINLVKDEASGEVTNWDDVMRVIKEKCQSVYGTAAADDLTNPDNAVNRFVAYHLLYGKISYNNLVHHYNEFNYKYGNNKEPQRNNCPTNVWDYYTTMGNHRGLVKITQVGDAGFEQDKDHKVYVNRISEYDNTRGGDYHETGVKDRGILLSAENGEYDNNALNGFFYPIDKILLYTDHVRDMLAGERMRIDMVTMLPELLTNNNRGNDYTKFPIGYIENIMNVSSGTNILYLMDAWSPGGGGWNDYQGDEMMFTGLYDFVLRLPPVPKSGTYELRMGVAMNPLRGMSQIYFGDHPDKLTPAGLPYDMRQTVGGTGSSIPWVADVEDDEVNAENDKNLRNQGYLKGPQYFTVTNGKADTPVRARSGSAAAIRRIVGVFNMEADKTYYLRFKTALKKLDSQFFLDYFEFVPTQVYNGPTPEDIW